MNFVIASSGLMSLFLLAGALVLFFGFPPIGLAICTSAMIIDEKKRRRKPVSDNFGLSEVKIVSRVAALVWT